MAKKRRKRRKLKIKRILLLLVILVIIGFAVYYLITLPIKNIYITGNKIIPDTTIIEESNINTGH